MDTDGAIDNFWVTRYESAKSRTWVLSRDGKSKLTYTIGQLDIFGCNRCEFGSTYYYYHYLSGIE